MAQLEKKAGLHPQPAVGLHAQTEGKPVGGGEAHRLLPLQKQVGIGPQCLQRPVAEPAVQRHGQHGGQAVSGEKIQQTAHPHLKPEGLPQRQGLFSGDSPQAGEPLRLLLQNAQGVRSEFVHQPPGGGGAHPLQGPGGQIVQNRLFPRGHAPLGYLCLELLAVGAVPPPGAVYRESLSRRRPGQAAHHGQFPPIRGFQAQNSIAVVLIAKDHGGYGSVHC
ncbi:hypothetical protein SDC9_110986 [bioreactor metagenome]|uniref:Uncharacterized protein n=1 Tax=bioreactor metagenome TaxID=1076179 RepID=A0A645BF74_9ZZZZ